MLKKRNKAPPFKGDVVKITKFQYRLLKHLYKIQWSYPDNTQFIHQFEFSKMLSSELQNNTILSKPIFQQYIQDQWYPNQILKKRSLELQQVIARLEKSVPFSVRQDYFYKNTFFDWLQEYYILNKLQVQERAEELISSTTWISCMEFLFGYCMWILMPVVDTQQDILVSRKLWRQWLNNETTSVQLFDHIRRQILERRDDLNLFRLLKFVQQWIKQHWNVSTARQVVSTISKQVVETEQEAKTPVELQKQQQLQQRHRRQQEMSVLFVRYFYNKYCRTKYTTQDLIRQYQQEFLQ